MRDHTTGHGTGNVRSIMQPRRPVDPGRIEKAKNPRHALIRLLPYLSPYKAALVMVLVFVVIYVILGLIGPYLMGVAIDCYISVKEVSGLAWIALLMLAVYLLNNLFQAIANWVMAGISQKGLKQMRQDLFRHLQALSLAFFDRNSPGELMSRLTNDIDAINQAVSQNVITLIASVLSMAGIVVAMFILNVWLALVTILIVPLMFSFTEFVAPVIPERVSGNCRNIWGC